MTLIVKFEQDGEAFAFEIASDTTLVIKGTANREGNTLHFSGDGELFVDGLAPWAGTRMVVKIAQVNVRHEPNTDRAKITSLLQGTELTVVSETHENLGFLWRQIIEPAELSGKWVAQEKVGIDEVYIVPASSVSTPEQSIKGTQSDKPDATSTGHAPTPDVVVTTNAQSVDDTPAHQPAPLTGRFQLVEKHGPRGTYTALAIDGDDKPKLGVNIREFPHFGIPQWQWADPNSRDQYCQAARDLGMKWVRFFTPHISYNNIDENLKRIGETLDSISKHGLIAVVTLTDSLADVGMFPKEDGHWHEQGTPMGHYHKDYFNMNAFRPYYHPYVKQVVSTFKDHAGVGMWQLMNEPALYMPPASDTDVEGFARWVDETSAMIYEMDTVHPISIGMINVSHIKPPHRDGQQFATDFYSGRKHIHVVTCHSYQSISDGNSGAAWDLEDQSMLDIHAAAKTGRAMIWTEFGASQASNRTQSTERYLNRQLLENGASAALQWGFMITSNDTGIGDRHFGWSPANINKEYNEMKQLFASYPARVSHL
ncbi:MAG: cellulase family glycosylhydrolase [Phototrophicaceae bacterium]